VIEAKKLRVDEDMGMGGGMKGVEGDLIPFFSFFFFLVGDVWGMTLVWKKGDGKATIGRDDSPIPSVGWKEESLKRLWKMFRCPEVNVHAVATESRSSRDRRAHHQDKHADSRLSLQHQHHISQEQHQYIRQIP